MPEPGNPQGLNRYSYVLNNALKFTDPTGHANECATQVDSGCDLGPILPTQLIYAPPDALDNVAAVTEVVASVLFEPADWIITGRDILEGKGSPWMLLGLLPFVPSSVGKHADEALGIAKRLDKDLFAFGNRAGPRAPRVGTDILPDPNGVLGPQAPPLPKGASTFSDEQKAPLTGHYHRLPAGTELPQGLDVVADGLDVDSRYPNPATHHTIFNTVEMALDHFIELFGHLPWEYGGKK